MPPTSDRRAGSRRPQPAGRKGSTRHVPRTVARPDLLAHPRSRARFLLLAVGLVFSLFAVQLMQLQGFGAKPAADLAANLRTRKVTTPALRGSITDVNGVVLSESTERVNITADPTAVAAYGRKRGSNDPNAMLRASEIIAEHTGGDPYDYLRILRANSEKRFVYLDKDVSPKAWFALAERRIPGLFAEHVMRREYPQGEATSNLVGLVNAEGKPAAGLEQVVNEHLHGTPGTEVQQLGGLGELIASDQTVAAVPGCTVRTTIDRDIQWYAYDRLRQRVRETGALGGYVVVQSKDGRLLAVASYPGYDPRAPKGGRELNSGAFADVFEPGSSGKLITVAAALEEGKVSPQSKVIVPSGMTRAGARFKDSHAHGILHMTVAGVLATSSNMGTMLIGETVEPETIEKYMRAFGLGKPSGIGFPGESPGLLTPAAKWDGQQRYTVMYGQGMAMTAVQQSAVMQPIINGGVRIPPRLIDGMTCPDQDFQPAPQGKPEQVISKTTADQLIEMMEPVVTKEGTAPQAAIPGYNVAGKTSTASRVNPKTGRYDGYTSAFVGLAPAEDPQFVVSVVLQKPSGMPYGGVVAGPVFADVMNYVLQSRSVLPSGKPARTPKLTFDPKSIDAGETPVGPSPGTSDEPAAGSLDDVVLRDEGRSQ